MGESEGRRKLEEGCCVGGRGGRGTRKLNEGDGEGGGVGCGGGMGCGGGREGIVSGCH